MKPLRFDGYVSKDINRLQAHMTIGLAGGESVVQLFTVAGSKGSFQLHPNTSSLDVTVNGTVR